MSGVLAYGMAIRTPKSRPTPSAMIAVSMSAVAPRTAHRASPPIPATNNTSIARCTSHTTHAAGLSVPAVPGSAA